MIPCLSAAGEAAVLDFPAFATLTI